MSPDIPPSLARHPRARCCLAIVATPRWRPRTPAPSPTPSAVPDRPSRGTGIGRGGRLRRAGGLARAGHRGDALDAGGVPHRALRRASGRASATPTWTRRRTGSTGRPSATSTRRSSSPPTTPTRSTSCCARWSALLEDPFTGLLRARGPGRPDEPVDPSYGGIGALVDTGAAGEDSRGPAHHLRLRRRLGQGGGHPGARPRRRRGGRPLRTHRRHPRSGGHRASPSPSSRPGEEPREVTLERRRIEPLILPGGAPAGGRPGVGYLRVISLSGQEAIDGIEQALTRFVARRAARRPGHRPARLQPGRAWRHHWRRCGRSCPETWVTSTSASGKEPIEIEPSDLADDYARRAGRRPRGRGHRGRRRAAGGHPAGPGPRHRGRRPDVGPDARRHRPSTSRTARCCRSSPSASSCPDGQTLEGQGVTPDVEVTADWLDYPGVGGPLPAGRPRGYRVARPSRLGPRPRAASPAPSASAAASSVATPPDARPCQPRRPPGRGGRPPRGRGRA